MVTRSEILVQGIVQGVGFRPFVYTRASRRDLRGRVLNNATGVLIEVEGNSGDIARFVRDLESNSPPLSTIESVECTHNLEPANYPDFAIVESAQDGEKFVPISADIATCQNCLIRRTGVTYIPSSIVQTAVHASRSSKTFLTIAQKPLCATLKCVLS